MMAEGLIAAPKAGAVSYVITFLSQDFRLVRLVFVSEIMSVSSSF